MTVSVAHSAPDIQDGVFLALRLSKGAFLAASTTPHLSFSPMFDADLTAAAIPPLSSPTPIATATALLTEMANCGDLPAERVAAARTTLFYLLLWEARKPTEISDGSDGDLSLIWLDGDLAASLSFTADEILGYAFKPGMLKPWLFEGESISVEELNTFVRAIGRKLG